MLRHSRRAVLALGAASVLVACSSVSVAPLPGPVSDRPEDLSRDDIVAMVNATRRANGGYGPWRYNPALETAARAQARLMARQDTLSHDLGTTLRERVTEAGYALAVGENVAKGYTTLPAALEGWLGSSGHRNTLLSIRFIEFGLAFARTSSGKLYWALIAGGPFEAWRN